MYDIELTPEANEDLKAFRKFEQRAIVDEIEAQLSYEPSVQTRNRKEMRPNEVAAGSCVSARSGCSIISTRSNRW